MFKLSFYRTFKNYVIVGVIKFSVWGEGVPLMEGVSNVSHL